MPPEPSYVTTHIHTGVLPWRSGAELTTEKIAMPMTTRANINAPDRTLTVRSAAAPSAGVVIGAEYGA